METGPNIMDLVLMAVMAFFVIRALFRGFVRELTGLAGMVAAIVISSLAFKPVAGFLQNLVGQPSPWWEVLAFILVLAAVFACFIYLGGILYKIINAGPFSALDRLAGAGVGLAKAVLVCYLIINLLLLVAMINPGLQRNLTRSYLAPYVVRGGRYLMDLVPDNVIRSLQDQAGLLGRSLGSDKPAPKPASRK